MRTMTIELPDDQAQKLKETAEKFGVSSEELARAGVQGLLSGPEEEFLRIFNYVMNRNADLYQRLA